MTGCVAPALVLERPHPIWFQQGYDPQAYNSGAWNAGATQGQPADQSAGGWAQDNKAWGMKKRLVPSEPSAHVIFLGLDPDFTEADVCLAHPVAPVYDP